jgi:tetratricopeptide (TPR) repeat protein
MTAKKTIITMSLVIASPFLLLLSLSLLLHAYMAVLLYWPGYGNLVKMEGNPIVESMYRYKNENGIWPQYLNDLVPKYLKTVPDKHWIYSSTLTCPAYPYIYYAGSKVPLRLGYSFENQDSYWSISARESGRQLGIKPQFTKAALNPEQVKQNMSVELHKRIAREPNEIAHYKILLSLLFKNGQYQDVVAESESGIRTMHENCWLRVAQALALSRLGNENGGNILEEWVKNNPSFFNYYHLAYYWRTRNNSEKALEALKNAAKYEPTTPSYTRYMHWFYGKEAAYYAYCHQAYDIAMNLNNLVEHLPRAYDEEGYAMHAAISLKTADFNTAQVYAQRIIQLNDWQASDYRSLLEAVKKSDLSFNFNLPDDETNIEFWQDTEFK